MNTETQKAVDELREQISKPELSNEVYIALDNLITAFTAALDDANRLASYKDQTATTFMNQVTRLHKELDAAQRGRDVMGCTLAGPGRGDCAHYIGLPGKSIPGQHDGKDDTVDVYGKPNGWCWSCWKDHKLSKAKALVASYDRQDEIIGPELAESVDEVTEVIRILKQERDQAQAACAAKDAALDVAAGFRARDSETGKDYCFKESLSYQFARADDCGTGWHSPTEYAALEAKLRHAKAVVEMLWHDDEMGYIVVGSIRECVKCGQKAETGKLIQHDPDCVQSPMEKVLYGP